MDWLHQAQTARQNHTRQSQMKKLLVLSGFMDQKFAGNLEKVGMAGMATAIPIFGDLCSKHNLAANFV